MLSLHYSSQPFSEAAVAPRDLVVGYGNLKCGLVDTARLFVLQAATDHDDRPLPGSRKGGVQQISLEHHEVTLADHHDHVVPFGALGAMTGDGIRELELRPVLAFVVDEPLALSVLHAQRQRCGANVHDLARLAVETKGHVIVLADKKPVSESKDHLAT